MKVKKILTIMVVCFSGLIFRLAPAQAALITIEIEAVVDSVDDPFGYLEGKIIVGDIITGSYTYDSLTPDSNPWPTLGRYEYHAPPYGIFLSVGGFEFETNPGNVDFFISIENDHPPDDNYLVRSHNNLPLSNGTLIGGISWLLNDPTGNALSSTDLLTTAPVLDDWGFNRLTVNGGTPAIPFGILSHVTSAIPEPGTIMLLGLGGLMLRRRTLKKR